MDDSQARFEQRRASGADFLADLDSAWKAALAQEETDGAKGLPMTTLARQIHLGLLASSLNSVAAAMSPALVARLVADGQWTLERALALVERMPDPRLRVLAYRELLHVETLDGAQCRQLSARAVAILGEIPESTGWAADPSPRGRAICALAPRLEEEALGQAVHMAMTLPGMCFRGEFGECIKTVVVLATRLRGELVEQALKGISSRHDPAERVVGWGVLAARLPEARRQKLLAQVLRDTLAMDNPWDRALALGVLAPQMQGESLEQILGATMQLTGKLTSGSGGPYPALLAQLGPALSGAQMNRLLQAVVKIEGDYHRLDALAALSPNLDDDGLALALQTVMEEPKDHGHRVRTLAELAPRLKSAQLDHVLQMELAWPAPGEGGASGPLARLDSWLSPGPTPRLTEDVYRANLLCVLVPHISDEYLERVLQEARVMQNPIWRGRLFLALALRWQGPDRGEVLKDAVEAALVNGGTDCADAFRALAPILEGDLLERAVQGAVGLGGSVLGPAGRSPIAEVLSALAPYLRGELLAQALQGALDIADDCDRETVLIALAPICPTSWWAGRSKERSP